jgi:hypothetical protein
MSDYPGSSYQSAPNSTMALISLISGILGLTLVPFLGSIVALILGYMAKKEIRESAGLIGGDGLAIAGIVLGWVGVGLLVIACCLGAFFLVPACLIPLGISLEEFGSFLPPIRVAF